MNTSQRILALMATVGWVALTGCGRPAVQPNHQVSLRLADSVESTGMTPSIMLSTGSQVFLHSKDIIVGSDFERIWTTTGPDGRPVISFRVSEAAAQKLGQVTGDNPGKMIAFVVSGVPQTAIPISSPFSESFQVNGAFSETQIKHFYTAITGHSKE